MEVYIQFQADQKVSKMEMKGASQESEGAIIAGFFGALGAKREPQEISITPILKNGESGRVSPSTISKEVKEKVITAIEKDAEKTLDSQPISRKLPKVDAELRSEFPIEDVARLGVLKPHNIQVDTDKPEHWETGIKTDEDGTKRYKCRYWCGCGNQGNRYIPLDYDFVYCHECDTEIDCVPATQKTDEKGVPERDGFGNFFVAR